MRGDIARAYLYMARIYGMTLTEDERQRFEAWHEGDPPDSWEATRNERVF